MFNCLNTSNLLRQVLNHFRRTQNPSYTSLKHELEFPPETWCHDQMRCVLWLVPFSVYHLGQLTPIRVDKSGPLKRHKSHYIMHFVPACNVCVYCVYTKGLIRFSLLWQSIIIDCECWCWVVLVVVVVTLGKSHVKSNNFPMCVWFPWHENNVKRLLGIIVNLLLDTRFHWRSALKRLSRRFTRDFLFKIDYY